jgi:autotransporter-associated beta strand protein
VRGGEIQQNGTGTTVLTNIFNLYTGNTTVNAGTLQVDGSIAFSSLTSVNNTGTLTGTGAIGQTQVNAGGILAPGNGTPGTQMGIFGDLTFAPGGIYRVAVDPTQASSAVVFGTANLGGATVNAQFAPGSYLANQYLIMQAFAVNGAFDPAVTTTNLPAGFEASLSYLGSDVFLDLIARLGGGGIGGGLPQNPQNVANTLNHYFNNGGTLPPAFVTLFGMTGDALQNALSQISGEPAASVSTSSFMAWNYLFNMVFDPYAQNRGGFGGGGSAMPFAATANTQSDAVRLAYAAVSPKGDLKGGLVTKAPPPAEVFASRWSVWGGGYGGTATTDGNAQVGSHDTTSRAYGFAVGADHRLTPDTIMGFALAGGGTSFGLDRALGSASPTCSRPRSMRGRTGAPPI